MEDQNNYLEDYYPFVGFEEQKDKDDPKNQQQNYSQYEQQTTYFQDGIQQNSNLLDLNYNPINDYYSGFYYQKDIKNIEQYNHLTSQELQIQQTCESIQAEDSNHQFYLSNELISQQQDENQLKDEKLAQFYQIQEKIHQFQINLKQENNQKDLNSDKYHEQMTQLKNKLQNEIKQKQQLLKQLKRTNKEINKSSDDLESQETKNFFVLTVPYFQKLLLSRYEEIKSNKYFSEKKNKSLKYLNKLLFEQMKRLNDDKKQQFTKICLNIVEKDFLKYGRDKNSMDMQDLVIKYQAGYSLIIQNPGQFNSIKVAQQIAISKLKHSFN